MVFGRGQLCLPGDNWHSKSGDIFHLHHSGVEHRASGGERVGRPPSILQSSGQPLQRGTGGPQMSAVPRLRPRGTKVSGTGARGEATGKENALSRPTGLLRQGAREADSVEGDELKEASGIGCPPLPLDPQSIAGGLSSAAPAEGSLRLFPSTGWREGSRPRVETRTTGCPRGDAPLARKAPPRRVQTPPRGAAPAPGLASNCQKLHSFALRRALGCPSGHPEIPGNQLPPQAVLHQCRAGLGE